MYILLASLRIKICVNLNKGKSSKNLLKIIRMQRVLVCPIHMYVHIFLCKYSEKLDKSFEKKEKVNKNKLKRKCESDR